MIEGACGFSGKYLAPDPHTIRMPIRARVYWLYRFFAAGLDVLLLDTDIIVERDPFAFFRKHPGHSIIGALDGRTPYNSGVFYARHIDACRDYLTQSLLEEYARRCVEWGGFEQSVCIDVVATSITATFYAIENQLVAWRNKTRVVPLRLERDRRVAQLAQRAPGGEVAWVLRPLPPPNGGFRTVDELERVPNAARCNESAPVASFLGVRNEFIYNVALLCKRQPWLRPALVHLSGVPNKNVRPSIVDTFYNSSRCLIPSNQKGAPANILEANQASTEPLRTKMQSRARVQKVPLPPVQRVPPVPAHTWHISGGAARVGGHTRASLSVVHDAAGQTNHTTAKARTFQRITRMKARRRRPSWEGSVPRRPPAS